MSADGNGIALCENAAVVVGDGFNSQIKAAGGDIKHIEHAADCIRIDALERTFKLLSRSGHSAVAHKLSKLFAQIAVVCKSLAYSRDHFNDFVAVELCGYVLALGGCAGNGHFSVLNGNLA